jgi:hypothetical protein
MMVTTEERRGTVSAMDQEEVPPSVAWPFFKTGSALLALTFAEEVQLTNAWWCVLEKPFFAGQVLAAEPKPSLWEKLARLRSMIPAEERRKYPADSARNLDKYLYGSKNLE